MKEAQPIKIIRIITRLNVGGPAQQVSLLTAGLDGDLFESKLVTGRIDDGEGDMSFLPASKGISFTQVESLCNGLGPIEDLRSFWQVYQILKKERPGIVHLHLLKARFLGGLAAKLARVPVIVETFHGNLFSEYYGKLKTKAILAAESFLGWLIMDRVIAISERQREELIRYRICPEAKISVIPLGLDLDRFLHCPRSKGKLRKELGLSDDTFLIGAVGRLVPIKGLNFLLDAIRSITAQSLDHNFCLVVVGDGPLRSHLELQASALGIEKRVRFLGWRFDLERIYPDLDVVVLTSLNEGTPVSLIEAMAVGKAVVATDVGGVPDVVEDGRTGLLVPSKDPAALADAMVRLLGDADLRNGMGARARVDVYAKYNVSRLIRDMKNLYLNTVPTMTVASVNDAAHADA